MVHGKHKTCGQGGCTKRPTYGVEGAKEAKLCCEHAREGMADVISKRCGHYRCELRPSHGSSGRKPEFCASV